MATVDSTIPASAALPESALPRDWTLAQLQAHLGGVPLDRIRLYPPPGMARAADLEYLVEKRFVYAS